MLLTGAGISQDITKMMQPTMTATTKRKTKVESFFIKILIGPLALIQFIQILDKSYRSVFDLIMPRLIVFI